ncbi:MAG: PEP-utilizing enzyme [Actinomycetota bacterium]|nr:PEP-utilizing enzyme [Actinomycetota bacterium]
MEGDYEKIVRAGQSVLLATLTSSGIQEPWFQRSAGWEYGVRRYRYEYGWHWISRKDWEGLSRIAAETGESTEQFARYKANCSSTAQHLLSAARSLTRQSAREEQPLNLGEGFAEYGDGVKQGVPFLIASAELRGKLRQTVIARITEEIRKPDTEEAAEAVARLAASGSEAVREMRSCYRIALEVSKDAEALDLVRDRFPSTALAGIESDYPLIHQLIERHVEEYGWVRASSYTLDPLSPRELLERIQKIVLRWKSDTIAEAAEEPPSQRLEEILGFSPSGPLKELAGALVDVVASRCFRADLQLQAEAVARPFLARVAQAAGCDLLQALFASVEEIESALEERGALPLEEIDLRIRNGFSVERSDGQLNVNSYASRPAEDLQYPAVGGQSVSLGRAVGRVKLVVEPLDVLGLELGDVLVTEASTPDKMGTESAFPSRTDAPAGIQKASAIVADEGGLLSHAAIVSREFGIPCVVGAERATKAFSDGQVVEVDATKAAGRIVAWEPAVQE